MPRYIIECDDPLDIVPGMRAIRSLIKDDNTTAIVEFENGSLWFVKKTKSGYSARTKGNNQ